MSFKRKMMRILKWVAAGVAAFVLVVCLAFALAQTDWGKRRLANWLAAGLSAGTDMQVEVGKLEGIIPFDFCLVRLAILDTEEPLIGLDNLRLQWSPEPLLEKKIHIKEISADQVTVHRLPPSSEATERREREKPVWPPKIPSIMLERLHIGRLDLNPTILGEGAVFTINGWMKVVDLEEGLKASFHLERLDGPTAVVTVEWTLRGDTPELFLNAAVEEASGGLLSAASGLRDLGSLSAKLNGAGSLQNWRGELAVGVENLGSIKSKIQVSSKGDIGLVGEGEVLADHDVFPRELPAFTQNGKILFSLDLEHGGKRELVINRALFETGLSSLELAGRFDYEKEEFASHVSLNLGKLSALSEIVDTELGGHIEVSADISGPLDRPEATLSLKVLEARVAEVRASSVMSDIKLALLKPIEGSFPGLSVEGAGHIRGLQLENQADLPLDDFQYFIDAHIPGSGPMSIRTFRIKDDDFEVEGAGKVDPTDLSLQGLTTVQIKDLSCLSGLLKTQLSGSAQIRAELEGDLARRSLSAVVSGQLNDVSPVPHLINTLAGPAIECKAHLELKEAERLTVSDLEIKFTGASLSGKGAFGLTSKDVEGQWQVEIPRLRAFSDAVGRKFDGQLRLGVTIGGSLSDVEVALSAIGHNVLLEKIHFPEVIANIRAKGLPAKPQGHFQIDLQQGPFQLETSSGFAIEGHELALSNLFIKAPGGEIKGDIRLDFKEQLAEGFLNGEVDDLAFMSELLGAQMAGSVRFTAQLSRGNSTQDMRLDMLGNQLLFPYGRVDTVELRADVKDVLHAFEGITELRVRGFHKETLEIESLTLTAEGGTKQIGFLLGGQGLYGEPFEIRTEGHIDLLDERMLLWLENLQGKYAHYLFALERPTTIHRSDKVLVVEETDLTVASGRLLASGRVEGGDVALQALFEDIPLEILRLLGSPELRGSASGQIHVSGRAYQPDATLALRIMEARLGDSLFQDLPVVHLTTDARLDKGLLRAEARLEGPSVGPVEAKMQLPVAFSLEPFVFTVPPNGEIQGSVAGEADLSTIPSYVQLKDQTLQGRLVGSFAVSGTVQTPRLTGDINVSEAAYENLSTGTILRGMQAVIKLEGARLVMEEAFATDGEAGTVAATGWLDISDPGKVLLDVNVTVDKATLVRRDDLTTALNGGLKFAGTPADAVLSGELKMGPAELRIPDRLPADITEVAVVEVNRPVQKDQPKAKPPPPTKPSKLALDLSVELPGQVFVRGRGIDSEWQGNLRLKGSAEEPSVVGVLSMVRGHCNLLGKRFEVTKGNLNFTGNVPPAPYFDVTAEKTGKDITARIRITGTPASLSLSLESDPELPRDEILARVLFGRSVAEITPVQAVLLADAVTTLSGGGSGSLDIMGRTRKLTGLDQVDMRQSEEENEGPSIGAGKYLTEDIYVEVEQGKGPDSGEVAVEIDLTPNISVESETGADAESGVGVNLKWDY
jgi:translocation and assembly module TamB